MPSQKTETLTVRLAPDIKAALRDAAAQEHRSLANMLEVMIRHWCRATPIRSVAPEGSEITAVADHLVGEDKGVSARPGKPKRT